MQAVTCALAVLWALAAGLLALVCGTPPAAAQEPVASVRITLTAIKPALPERDGTITLRGRVTNIGDAPVSHLQAILWRSRDPILTAEAMGRVLASESDDPLGERLYDRDYQNIPSDADRTLAPEQSTEFTLRTEVANLDLPRADGVYLIGVHVRGQLPGDPRDATLGRARTFLPLIGTKPATTVQQASVVLLTSRPSLLRDGVLADDHLAAEVAPHGRLSTLLRAADADKMSFAVDPSLIEELQTMAGGYVVAPAGQPERAGAGQQDATRWLADFDEVADRRDGYRLPYGNPDLAALVHDRQTALLQTAAEAGRAVEATRALPLLVVPPGGMADAATVDAADRLDPKAIVLSDASAQGVGPVLAGPGGVPIVQYPTGGFAGGPGPDPRDTPVQLQQRALADTWIEAATSTADTAAHGRVRLIGTPDQAAGDDGAVEAPWISRATLAELLRPPPRPWQPKFRYPSAARSAELGLGQLAAVRQLARSQSLAGDLLVEPERPGGVARTAVARAASASWRRHAAAQRAYLTPQQAALDGVLQRGVQISSTARVQTVAREGVEFPITVRNDLPVVPDDPDANAVRVRLVFTSDNRRRLSIKSIEAPLIRAGSSFTANAEVTAKANGVVPVTAQLQTVSGQPVGRPVQIEVQVTQNGTTGWAIAIAAGVVLAGTTALRIRQVARERSAAPQPAGPSGLSSAPPDSPESAPRESLDA